EAAQACVARAAFGLIRSIDAIDAAEQAGDGGLAAGPSYFFFAQKQKKNLTERGPFVLYFSGEKGRKWEFFFDINKIKAIAYLRTSSAANVGTDKDSDKRQRAAIAAFAKARGYQIVEEFYDAAVSGADPINERPGFKAMLDRIAGNGVKVILVESPDRFARDLAVQLAGHSYLEGLGVELVPTTAPDFFTQDTPTAVLVRQVLGAISQFEKASLVAKLRAARERKVAAGGRGTGRWRYDEARPEVVALARELHGQGMSYRKISAALAERGHVTSRGKPYVASAVQTMLMRGGFNAEPR